MPTKAIENIAMQAVIQDVRDRLKAPDCVDVAAVMLLVLLAALFDVVLELELEVELAVGSEDDVEDAGEV